MIKLIHFADLHLNAPLTSRVSWDTANQLRESKCKVIDRIIELSNQKKADLILIAGDLFDRQFTDEKTFRFLEDRFSRTQAHIFIACGNHDCFSEMLQERFQGGNVHIFGTQMEQASLPELHCDIYGQSFGTETVRESMLSGFRVVREDVLNLMVLHGDLQHPSDYNPICPEDIRNSGLDFLALGHIHNEKEIKRIGDTYYGYAGIPQPHSFKDSGEPSVHYIELSKQDFYAEQIDVSEFRFHQVAVSVSSCRTLYDISRAVLEQTKGYERQRDLFEVTLQGEVAEDFRVDTKQLEEMLGDSFLHIEIRNKTSLSVNIELLKQERTLRGEFVRLVLGDEELTEEEKKEVLECGIKAGNPLIEKEGLL